MITGWLVKIVMSFALVGLALFEGTSPLLTRAQIDGPAHEAADTAALGMVQHNDPARARAEAEAILTEKEVALKDFTVDQSGVVRLTVERQARSVLLKHWSRTAAWYDVELSVTGGRKETR